MLFDKVGGCARFLLYALAILVLGLVVICVIPGCMVGKPKEEASAQGIGNKVENKPSSLTQDQIAAKVVNAVDNSQKETNVDNRVNFAPIQAVAIPDEPSMPEFPDMFRSSAGVTPAAVSKCRDDDSCLLPASVMTTQNPPTNPPAPPSPPAPSQVITTPAPNVNIDLNPVLIQQQEKALAVAADTHRRELETIERNYAARLAAADSAAKRQTELMQKQADITNQLAEKRIAEKEREITALAQGEAVKIRATEEKWRILAWTIGIGLGVCTVVTLLMRSPIDRWRERKQKQSSQAATMPLDEEGEV